MAHSQVAGGGMASNMEVATNILNKQSWAANKGWSFRLEVGQMLTPHHKKLPCYEILDWD